MAGRAALAERLIDPIDVVVNLRFTISGFATYMRDHY